MADSLKKKHMPLRGQNDRVATGESGNVLFLILIAVALFAYLSYAVGQSTRSGEGGSVEEKNLISSSALAEYPVGVRAVVMKMIINGVAVEELEFNPPSAFLSPPQPQNQVFHPQGGNATYQEASSSIMSGGYPGTWHFVGLFEIDDIGTEVPGSFAGNDIAAVLVGVKTGVCTRLNKKAGINGALPALTAPNLAALQSDLEDGYMGLGWTPPSTELEIGETGNNGTDALTGHPFGCFQADGVPVYYQVLVER
jgi:hypothetical protein